MPRRLKVSQVRRQKASISKPGYSPDRPFWRWVIRLGAVAGIVAVVLPFLPHP